MIRITVELLPHGTLVDKKFLGRIDIANIGRDPEGGFYRARFFNEDTLLRQEIEVEGHDRSSGVWSLLRRCLLKFDVTPGRTVASGQTSIS